MRRGRGRARWSQRQSFSRMSLRQKARRGAARGGWQGWWGPASRSPWVFLRGHSHPRGTGGTVGASVLSRAVAGDNWVSLSPSNRAPSLRMRNGREKGRAGATPPKTRDSLFPCTAASPSQPHHRPYPPLTPPSSPRTPAVPEVLDGGGGPPSALS